MPVPGPLNEQALSAICMRTHQLLGQVIQEKGGKAESSLVWELPEGKEEIFIATGFPDGTPHPYVTLYFLFVAAKQACDEMLGTYTGLQLKQVYQRLKFTSNLEWAMACGHVDINGRQTEIGREFWARQEAVAVIGRALDQIRFDDLGDVPGAAGEPEP